MTRVDEIKETRIHQGDIIANVSYIENVDEIDGAISVSRIVFPVVIVLSQECDLTWDFDARNKSDGKHDKYLISAIVAPLYNYEHFLLGEHLSELGQTMRRFPSKKSATEVKMLFQNEISRYHYLDFDQSIPIVNSIVDFKHYFTVNMQYLEKCKEQSYICSVSEIFRERISQRFAGYLSRIGLPV